NELLLGIIQKVCTQDIILFTRPRFSNDYHSEAIQTSQIQNTCTRPPILEGKASDVHGIASASAKCTAHPNVDPGDEQVSFLNKFRGFVCESGSYVCPSLFPEATAYICALAGMPSSIILSPNCTALAPDVEGVGVSKNVRRLLTPSEKRVSATTIIRNHDITHGTIIPISKNFDGFRNMGNAACNTLTLCNNEKEKMSSKNHKTKIPNFAPPLEEGSTKLSPNCTALAPDVEAQDTTEKKGLPILRKRPMPTDAEKERNMRTQLGKLFVGPTINKDERAYTVDSLEISRSDWAINLSKRIYIMNPLKELGERKRNVLYLAGRLHKDDVFVRKVLVDDNCAKVKKVIDLHKLCSHIVNVLSLRSVECDDNFMYLAFEGVHQNGFIYGCVTPQNVLVRKRPDCHMIKLCGFGKCLRIPESEKGEKGNTRTPSYLVQTYQLSRTILAVLTPETHKYDDNYVVDVYWTYGVIDKFLVRIFRVDHFVVISDEKVMVEMVD
nr:glutamine-tRNA ligase, putative / glutaminyl-tRNA synthetase, putative / GlnRS [Tanacetum cinerariifolium]